MLGMAQHLPLICLLTDVGVLKAWYVDRPQGHCNGADRPRPSVKPHVDDLAAPPPPPTRPYVDDLPIPPPPPSPSTRPYVDDLPTPPPPRPSSRPRPSKRTYDAADVVEVMKWPRVRGSVARECA